MSELAPNVVANSSVPDDPPALEVVDLTVSYQGIEKVHPISFSVSAGERLAIVGESGSGKSSIANAIGGFIDPVAGGLAATVMSVGGRSLLDEPVSRIPRRRPEISMIFQDAMSSLDPVWTVGSQLLSVLKDGHRSSRKDRYGIAEERLRQVGIADPRRVMDALPGQLSGGMRQRVMMAIALATEPTVLIADEPTSALDVSLSIAAMELLTLLVKEENAALVFISHDIALSRRYSDRMMVMQAGCAVETINSEHLDRANHPYTRGLLACMPTISSSATDRLPTLESVLLGEAVA